MVQFSCKHSFYNVQAGRNNVFTLTEDGEDVTITLAEGNYSVIELAAEIQTKLNEALINYSVEVSYSHTTGKYTYTRTLIGDSVTTSITFSSTLDTHEILGFAEGSTADITDSGVVSTSIVSVGSEEALYIHLSPTGNNLWISNVSDPHSNTDLFATIPILVSHFDIIYWEAMGGIRYIKHYRHGHNGNSIHVKITNEHNLPIELQSDFSMVFKLSRSVDYTSPMPPLTLPTAHGPISKPAEHPSAD